jgi:hypothetical protein
MELKLSENDVRFQYNAEFQTTPRGKKPGRLRAVIRKKRSERKTLYVQFSTLDLFVNRPKSGGHFLARQHMLC